MVVDFGRIVGSVDIGLPVVDLNTGLLVVDGTAAVEDVITAEDEGADVVELAEVGLALVGNVERTAELVSFVLGDVELIVETV